MQSIWVAEADYLGGRSYWGTESVDFRYKWFDFNLLSLFSIEELAATYQSGKTPVADLNEKVSDYLSQLNQEVVVAAWQFAHSIAIGDYVAICSQAGDLWVAEVTGDYEFTRNAVTHRHYRAIRMISHFDDMYALPKTLWPLFGGRTRLVADEIQLNSLREVLNGVLPKPASRLHILFDSMSEPTSSRAVQDLAFELAEHPSAEDEWFCASCGATCTQLLHIDSIDFAINNGVFVRWGAILNFLVRMNEAIEDGWLERLPGENNLAIARRFLNSLLEDWTDDVDTPILFGLRQGNEERWSWILVAYGSDGGHPASINSSFPTRDTAEAHLVALGCRSGDDLGAEQLRLFGITDPEGIQL